MNKIPQNLKLLPLSPTDTAEQLKQAIRFNLLLSSMEIFMRTSRYPDGLNRAESLFREIGTKGKSASAGSKLIMIHTLRWLCCMYRMTGRVKKSEHAGRRALSMIADIKVENDFQKYYTAQLRAFTRNELALLYYNTGKYDISFELWQKNLKYYRRNSDVKNIALTLGVLGILYHSRGDVDKSEEMFSNALNLLVSSFTR